MKRIAAICLAGAMLAACETGGVGPTIAPPSPPPPGPTGAAPPGGVPFNESDFAWSRGAAGGGILGVMSYGGGGARYSCGDVVLLPETPWTRERMQRLYGSTTQAALAVDEVRDRTPKDATDEAESRISANYARHAQCDASDRFSFANLPNGAWYIITVATPKGGGPKIALMRRVASYGFVFRAVLR